MASWSGCWSPSGRASQKAEGSSSLSSCAAMPDQRCPDALLSVLSKARRDLRGLRAARSVPALIWQWSDSGYHCGCGMWV